jgi:PDZ domain-containing protein
MKGDKMFNKLYETILKYIKKEYKFLLTLILVLGISTIKLPYYINMPGGIIDISDRINIDNLEKDKGTLNLAYVSEMKATIPTLIISKINKNWDIIKADEIIETNETEQDINTRDKIYLKESLSNAMYAGFKKANEEFNTKNNKIFIIAISKEAKTNLKIGDEIKEINNIEIKEKEDLKIIQEMKENQELEIKVINNNKEYRRNAKLIKMDNKILIGCAIAETFDIESKHTIDIDYNKKESGPSGGMMLSLMTYSKLTHKDLTKGRKIVGTGTIDRNGNVGEIGGVKYKLIGAVKNKADIFLVPSGENYEEAIRLKEKNKYNIKIVSIATLDDAIKELEKN